MSKLSDPYRIYQEAAYRTLVDVIGEIERERHPLQHVLTVTADGFTEDEVDALIGAVRSRPPFDGDGDLLRKLRAIRTKARRGDMLAKGTVMLNGGEQAEGLGPEPGILAPRVTPLTVEECRAIAPSDAEEKAFRAGVEVGRGVG